MKSERPAISTVLGYLIKDSGLTVRQLSRRTGVPVPHIKAIILSRPGMAPGRPLSMSAMYDLLDYFGWAVVLIPPTDRAPVPMPKN